jgi:hypothetical protein
MTYLRKKYFSPIKNAIVILLLGFAFLGYANHAAADLLTVYPVFDITGNTYIFPDLHPDPDDPFIQPDGLLTVGHNFSGVNSVWSAVALEFLLPIPKSSIDDAQLIISAGSASDPLSLPVHLYGYAGDGAAEFADTEVDSKTLLDSKTGLFSISYDATAFLKGLSGDYAGFTLAMTDPPYSDPDHPTQVIHYYSLESGEFPKSPPTLYIYYTSTAPIPIPGAVWLLSSGLLGMGAWRRFRKK